jgi:hypothetical protein
VVSGTTISHGLLVKGIMSALTSAIESGLKQIESYMDSPTFEYDGEQYSCHVGSQAVTNVLEVGGFAETQQIVLVVRKSQFTDGIYPQENDKITFRDVVYFVDIINTDATNTFLNIPLKKVK